MVNNRNYSALEDILANAERIVIKRPNGTTFLVKTSEVDRLLSMGIECERYSDTIKDVILEKDIISKVRLSFVLGVQRLDDLKYVLEKNEGGIKQITLFNDGVFIGTLTKYPIKNKRVRLKRTAKARYNALVKEVSKEYTFRLPDGRVVLGTDLSGYETAAQTGELLKAARFINDHTDHYTWDIDLLITIAYIMQRDGRITLGLINGLTGEHLAPLKIPDVLTDDNKEILHKRKKEYLDTLEHTTTTINNILRGV